MPQSCADNTCKKGACEHEVQSGCLINKTCYNGLCRFNRKG